MDKCFIIMPLTTPEIFLPKYSGDRDHFKHVIDHLIIPAIEQIGLEPIPPITKGSDVIHGEVIKHLETSDVVLCDMSCLNPNVFFELGIRTALNKALCLIKDDITVNVPFDTTIINYHTYLSALSPWTLKKDISDLSEHLKKSIENSKGTSSLWKYFSLSMRAEPMKERTGVEGKLELLTFQMDGMKKQLEKLQIGDSKEINTLTKVDLSDQVRKLASLFGARFIRSEESTKYLKITFSKGTLSEEGHKILHEKAQRERFKLIINESEE